MDARIHSLLVRGDGLVTRRDMLRVAPAWTIQTARRADLLIRLLPGVYGDAALIRSPNADLPMLARVERDVARRAALAYADGRGALSRLTALDVWGLRRQPPGEPVYLDLPRGSGLRDRPHLVVAHRSDFALAPPQVVIRAGLLVTRLDRTLVDCWPLLPPVDRSSLLIGAVNDR
ncbi:hypothetical protein AB0B94_21895 [Micromonospora sp. NPDC048986]|uniref:hypothetical protein n=1 Tax=Micromonospora sp. NPDC048986 TaxID=3155644 RepID=UPI003401778B